MILKFAGEEEILHLEGHVVYAVATALPISLLRPELNCCLLMTGERL